MMGPTRKLGRGYRAAWVSFVVIAALVTQEYAVRLALPNFNPTEQLRFLPAGDGRPVLGEPTSVFKLTKNSGDYDVTIRFNRYGLRDSKDVATARRGDILILGDSFAFGWGVEEADRISEQLQNLSGHRVFNAGMPAGVDGYEDMLSYVCNLGSQADRAVLVFNMSNDIADYDAPFEDESSAETSNDRGWSFRLLPVKDYLLTHSALYFLISSVAMRTPGVRELAFHLGLAIPLDRVPTQQIDEKATASTIAHLAKIAMRIRLIIVVVPDRGLWIGDHREVERQRHKLFLRALDAAGLSYIDMAKLEEEGGNPLAYHFTNDGHWRASGHALAARAVNAALAKDK